MLKIYCVHPISGRSADEVFEYYDRTQKQLTEIGYDVFIPMFGKGNLRTVKKFRAKDEHLSPLTKNHAIVGKDKWMVNQSDILYANFLGASDVSIGSMFELAWGSNAGKQVIVVMEEENIHQHAFVLEAATIIFETTEDAMKYLTQLAHKDFS